jgi:hypothetical protein
MSENPLVSDGKQFTSFLMENAEENVDAGIKIYRPSFSHSDAILKVSSGQDYSKLCSRDRLKKIYLIILVIKSFASILNYLQRGFEVFF